LIKNHAIRLAIAAVSVGLLAPLLVPPAQAFDTSAARSTEEPSWYSGNSSYGLDRQLTWITGPTSVNVVSTDNSPICRVTYGAQTITGAPWTVTLRPNGPREIEVFPCDSSSSTQIWLRLQTPFTVETPLVAAGSNKQSVTIRNNMPGPAQIAITDARGKIVSRGEIDADGATSLDLNTRGVKKTATWTVAVTNPGGDITMKEPLIVAYKWAPMYWGNPYFGPTVTPCSTVTWYYDAARQPNSARNMVRDIQPALNVLAKETGLTFTRVDSPTNATLNFKWSKNMSRYSSAAIGGYAVSFRDGTTTFSNLEVEFMRGNFWTTDRYAGLSYRNRIAGRGWLIIHEVMHTLGFDHVDDQREVMAPINRGQHNLGPGDRQGLRTLYPQTNCPR
jgi:hypothetical protein